jgi:hypothetical protein
MANPNSKAGTRLRKSPTGNERYIKVKQSYYDYRLKTQPTNTGSRCVPTIQMTGHWLRKAGFTINAPLTIQVREGCLVIRVAEASAANS